MTVRLSRRAMLRGAGGIAIALPWLEAMGRASSLGHRGHKAAGSGITLEDGRPKRLVLSALPNGVVPGTWFPSGGETNFSLGSSMSPPAGFEHLPSLEDFRDKLLVFKGLDNEAGRRSGDSGHYAGAQSVWTGCDSSGNANENYRATGPSIDQIVTHHIGTIETVPVPWIGAGEGGLGMYMDMNMNGVGRHMHAQPSDLFDTLFADGNLSNEQRLQQRLRRHSVLDFVLGSYNDLHGQLGVADRQRLASHLDGIREVEKRIDAEITCEMPDPGDYPPIAGSHQQGNVPDWLPLMIDLFVIAFACDISRVGCLSPRRGGGGTANYAPWLGLGDGWPVGGDYVFTEAADYHETSHREGTPSADETLTMVASWFTCATIGVLAERLAAVPEGSGTLLDSTLIVQASDIATGRHTMQDFPFVTIGDLGGELRTGRYLQLPSGTPHNRLLMAILEAFGVSSDTFGAPDLSADGPLDLS